MPSKPASFFIDEHRRVEDFGFLKVDHYTVRYRMADDALSRPLPRVNVNRGDAVAGLLHHVRDDGHWLYLVNQFRLSSAVDPDSGAPLAKANVIKPLRKRAGAPAAKPDRAGWMVELMAGGRMKDEPWVETLRRECMEETGFDLDLSSIEFIGSFFPSPGACSERIHLYYARIAAPPNLRPAKTAKGVDDEEVLLVPMSAPDFLDAIERNAIQDAKAIAAAEWMRRERNKDKFSST